MLRFGTNAKGLVWAARGELEFGPNMKGKIKSQIYTAGLMPTVCNAKFAWVQHIIHRLARPNWNYLEF